MTSLCDIIIRKKKEIGFDNFSEQEQNRTEQNRINKKRACAYVLVGVSVCDDVPVTKKRAQEDEGMTKGKRLKRGRRCSGPAQRARKPLLIPPSAPSVLREEKRGNKSSVSTVKHLQYHYLEQCAASAATAAAARTALVVS